MRTLWLKNRLPYNEVVWEVLQQHLPEKSGRGFVSSIWLTWVSEGGAYYANEGGSLSLSPLSLNPSFPLTLPSPVKGAKGSLLTHTYQHKPQVSPTYPK